MKTWMIVPLLALTLAACEDDAPALDQASVDRGKRLSENCSACHSLTSSRADMVGPSLSGVIGRKAGAVSGYDYSDAIKSSGLVWTPEEITRFIQDPVGVVPGTKMALGPLSPEEAQDVVNYLRSIAR
ncbi:c-type cytochrome [Tistrella mobilis]|uniref:c-type cytochrome n=1 Tax=Tistrella mobilis TaxID=171437 RepID=UPI0035569AEA